MSSDILKCKCLMCVSRFETLRPYKEDKIVCPNCGNGKNIEILHTNREKKRLQKQQ